MNQLVIVMRNIMIFLVVATILSNIFTGSSYQKIFTFTTGLIVMVLVVTPILSVLSGGDTMADKMKGYLFSIEEREFTKELESASQASTNQLKEQYQRKLEAAIQQSVKKSGDTCEVQVTLNEIGGIEKIQIRKQATRESARTLLQRIVTEYGIKEESIFIEEY